MDRVFVEPISNSPCDAFACVERMRCASLMLACDAFYFYVEQGRLIFPARQWCKKKRRLVLRKIAPSAEIYKNIFEQEDLC